MLRVISALIVGTLVTLLQGCGSTTIYDPTDDGSSGVETTTKSYPNRRRPGKRRGTARSYTVFGKRYHPFDDATDFTQRGLASWYGKKFHGNKTSNGEIYDMYAMTAAHKELPLPTMVEVINLENNRRIVVRVNDRGPFHEGRIIDLSYTAAKKLDIVRKGTGRVEIRAITNGKTATPSKNVAIEKNGRIYVQVGAFGEQNNAQQLAQDIEDELKRGVRVVETSLNSQTLYRVQIGPLTSDQTAEQVINKLNDIGIENSHRIYE